MGPIAIGADDAGAPLKERLADYLQRRGFEVRDFGNGDGLDYPDVAAEVAQAVAPDARVVYVDNDPVVLTHARALLTSSPEGATAYIDADLRDPDKILQEAAQTAKRHPMFASAYAQLARCRGLAGPDEEAAARDGGDVPGAPL